MSIESISAQATGRKARTRLAAAARLIVRTILFLLPALFAGLKLRNLSSEEISQVISNASAGEIVWKFALIIYFFSWVWGTLWDISIQEDIYLEVANRGRMPVEAFGVAALIFCVGGALAWVNNFVAFVSVLAFFTVIDHFAWRYLVKFLRPTIRLTAAEYTRIDDLIGLEQLRRVERQVCGTWKWWRGAMGTVLILSMLALALIPSPENLVKIGSFELYWNLIQAISILFWVLAMELWHWYVRINTKIAVNTLEEMRDHYKLVPRQSAP